MTYCYIICIHLPTISQEQDYT